MFNDVGYTIKLLAKILWWIGLITIVGIIVIWPMAFIIYGFGELIQKTTEIANNTKKTAELAVAEAIEKNDEDSTNNNYQQKIRSSVIENFQLEKFEEENGDPDFDMENVAKENECPACFHKISSSDIECSYCGYKLK